VNSALSQFVSNLQNRGVIPGEEDSSKRCLTFRFSEEEIAILDQWVAQCDCSKIYFLKLALITLAHELELPPMPEDFMTGTQSTRRTVRKAKPKTRRRRLLTAAKVAKKLKVSPATVYRMAQRGVLPAAEIPEDGRQGFMWHPDHVDQYLENRSA